MGIDYTDSYFTLVKVISHDLWRHMVSLDQSEYNIFVVKSYGWHNLYVKRHQQFAIFFSFQNIYVKKPPVFNQFQLASMELYEPETHG